MRNRFRPGAGLQPPYLAGRSAALRRLGNARDQIEQGEGASPITITGLRGMGKTVLLNYLRDELRSHGWLVPAVERFGPRRSLAQLWPRQMRDLERIQPKELVARAGSGWTLERLQGRLGGELGLPGARAKGELAGALSRRRAAEPEQLLDLMIDFANRADEFDLRVAILFDEAQEANEDDLGVLAELGQVVGERRLPVLLLLAGLGPLRDRLIKARTYATRFPSVRAASLAEADARNALVVPVEEEGGRWEEAALDAALDFAEGIPYHLQVIGQQAVELADGDLIGLDALVEAAPRAREEIEENMYRPLWRQASPAEQRYLAAMANVARSADGIPVRAVAGRLGKGVQQVAMLRQRLIEKGLVHGTRYGLIDFSYPGFDGYVRAEAEHAARG